MLLLFHPVASCLISLLPLDEESLTLLSLSPEKFPWVWARSLAVCHAHQDLVLTGVLDSRLVLVDFPFHKAYRQTRPLDTSEAYQHHVVEILVILHCKPTVEDPVFPYYDPSPSLSRDL